jgi:hypothetical protein
MDDLRLGNLTERAWEAFHTFSNEAQEIRNARREASGFRHSARLRGAAIKCFVNPKSKIVPHRVAQKAESLNRKPRPIQRVPRP